MKTIPERKVIKHVKAKKADIVKKMLEDKRFISNHISNGGSFEELKKMGFRFATV